MKILDLGCGPYKKKEGSIGMDIRPAGHVDVVHDINVFPYPFGNDEFDEIEMAHILEHADRPLRVLNEVHRIAKPGAVVRIITPHYSSQLSYGDLEHYHHFGWIAFNNLNKTGLFKVRKYKLWFTDLYKVFGISLLANLFPRRWEKYVSFIFPALYVEFFLEVLKPSTGGPSLLDRSIY